MHHNLFFPPFCIVINGFSQCLYLFFSLFSLLKFLNGWIIFFLNVFFSDLSCVSTIVRLDYLLPLGTRATSFRPPGPTLGSSKKRPIKRGKTGFKIFFWLPKNASTGSWTGNGMILTIKKVFWTLCFTPFDEVFFRATGSGAGRTKTGAASA